MSARGGGAAHRTSCVNEYFENERLLNDPSYDPRRCAFINALREYGRETEQGKKARLLETIIRASRGLIDDTGKLPADSVEILIGIKDRYHAFLNSSEDINLITYGDARKLLKALFF